MADLLTALEQLREEVGTDIDELRAKYAHERNRRMRPEGEAQYLQVAGEYAQYADDDPYAAAPEPREPLTDEIDVAVIGGGFSGMLAAARLREAGVDGIRIIEAGADFGGTWYWNRYPGAQCDTEAYCYLPLLEEVGYMPKEKYSYAPEIFEHSQRIAKHYDLYSLACFQTRVSSLAWDSQSMRWIVRTDRGDVMKARFVITANGSANRAKLPGIPGIRDFEGHSFHTNRWDYAYTGGDHSGNLHKLADKRVAIIGTGATAIQCVPHVGAHAKHLYAFQRTPSSVDWRGNKPTDPEWAASLKPGWQRERRENFDDILFGRPVEVDLIQDGWTQIFRDIGFWAAGRSTAASDLDKLALMNELADFKLMNRVRTRIEETVRDPATAEALKPWFRMLCKRPCFNDEYLPTFNRPNVTLVDTSDSLGVERITNKGVVVAGVEYQVDCIIYATGFELGTAPRRRYSFDITGKDGVSLFDHWRDGLRSLHGHSVHGFPNWFYIGLGQVGASANMTSMFDEQAKHVAYIIAEARQRGARTIETTAAAEQAWVDEIHSLSTADAKKFLQECTPGYYNNEGKPGQPGSLPAELYTPGLNPFNALLGEWRAKGTLDGLELRS